MSVAPELSNIFIVILFPKFFREMHPDDGTAKYDFKFFGLDDHKIINLVYMMKFLGNWLLINNFTMKKLEINTDP